MKKNLLLILIMLFALVSCSEHGKLTSKAEDNYAAANYDAAVRYAVQALRIKSDYEDAQKVLSRSFMPAVRNHAEQIAKLNNSSHYTDMDNLVVEYERLQEINKLVANLPKSINKKYETRDYSTQVNEARQRAAAAHYDEGKRLHAIGTVDDNKSASKHMSEALAYVKNFKDASRLERNYKEEGTKRIAVIPFYNKSGQEEYGAIGEMISDKVISAILNDKEASEFLQIVSRSEMDLILQEQSLGQTGLMDDNTVTQIGKLLGVHEILTGQITQIIADDEKTISKTKQVSQKVVVKKEPYTTKKGKTKYKDIYGDVYANLKTNELKTGAQVTCSYKIIDVQTAELIKIDTFSERYDYQHSWGSFKGDEKALDSSQKQLVKTSPKIPPSKGQCVNEAIDRISQSLTAALKEHTL